MLKGSFLFFAIFFQSPISGDVSPSEADPVKSTQFHPLLNEDNKKGTTISSKKPEEASASLTSHCFSEPFAVASLDTDKNTAFIDENRTDFDKVRRDIDKKKK